MSKVIPFSIGSSPSSRENHFRCRFSTPPVSPLIKSSSRLNFCKKSVSLGGFGFSLNRTTAKAESRGNGEVEGGGRRVVGRGPEQEQGLPSTEQGMGAKKKGDSLDSGLLNLFNLEKQFSFYGAYHSNEKNILIHVLFVWPIYFTAGVLLAYTPAVAALPLAAGTLPLQEYMVLNLSFLQCALFGLYYIALDRKAGFLGAMICLGCWVGANAIATALPWSLGWKIVLASQVISWSSQIFGHQKFEGRSPALLDNLAQAFLMAPFFVLLEGLQNFGYEPYPGFMKLVHENVAKEIREFRKSKKNAAA